MSISDAYDDNDGVGLAALVAAGEITAHELLDEAQARADERNPGINAIVHRFDDVARRQIEEGRGQNGPLAGVPSLLKDLSSDYAGTALTKGSRSWEGHVSTTTSFAVERFLDAGLVMFGKTNSPEFGLSSTTENVLHGPARNPWNHNHSPGGSSGGSGAAVAAGIVPIAHATDGGGSIRIPASCNGLVGLKPTRARTPSGPPAGEGWAGMSIGHVLCHTVRDSAAVLDATHGLAPGGPYDAPAPAGRFADAVGRDPGLLRVGWSTAGRPGITVSAEVAGAVEATAGSLEAQGHRVHEQSLDHIDWAGFGDAFSIITAVGVAADVRSRAVETGTEPSTEILEAMTLFLMETGSAVSAMDYLDAVDTIHRVGRANAALWNDIDVLVCPTTPAPPAELGTLAGPIETAAEWGPKLMAVTAFTGLFNATGQPAMSLPLAVSDDGLPIGVQIVGPFGGEETVLSVGAQLEQSMPWAGRRAR